MNSKILKQINNKNNVCTILNLYFVFVQKQVEIDSYREKRQKGVAVSSLHAYRHVNRLQAGIKRIITDLIFTINPFPCREFPLQGEEALKEISAKYLTVIAKKMIINF